MNMLIQEDTYIKMKITLNFQLRREYDTEKQKVMQSTMKQMEKEIERVKEEYRSKISEMEDKHKHLISDTKKKQWVSTSCRHIMTKIISQGFYLFSVRYQNYMKDKCRWSLY